jgi:hypothetical protein
MAMTVRHYPVGPGMAVVGALALDSLCEACIAARTMLPLQTVAAQLAALNAARQRRGRESVGPIDARCQRCEAPRPVYRLI